MEKENNLDLLLEKIEASVNINIKEYNVFCQTFKENVSKTENQEINHLKEKLAQKEKDIWHYVLKNTNNSDLNIDVYTMLLKIG